MATGQKEENQKNNSAGSNLKLPGPLSNIGGQTKNLAENYVKNKAEMLAKQAGKKLLQKAAMTPHFWLGVAIVVGIVILIAIFLMIITTILGQNSNNNQVVLPTLTPVQGQLLTCDGGDYSACLRDLLNVSVFGGTSADAKKIFDAFAFAAQSKQYLSLLTANGRSLRILIVGYSTKACSGLTIGFAGVITLTDGACFSIRPENFRYLLVHESGHIINARNRSLFASFPWRNLQQQDSSCYDRGYLKSYPLRCGSSCGINPKDESFAEAIADTLAKTSTNKAGFLSSQAINDFKNDCPATYSWIDANIYGGYSFY